MIRRYIYITMSYDDCHSSEWLFCDHLRPIENSSFIGRGEVESCDSFEQKNDTAVAENGEITQKSVELCRKSCKK